ARPSRVRRIPKTQLPLEPRHAVIHLPPRRAVRLRLPIEHPDELLPREYQLPPCPRHARPRHPVLPPDVVIGVDPHLEPTVRHLPHDRPASPPDVRPRKEDT